MNNIDIIKNEVTKLLGQENTGHGMDHINRVILVSSKFAENENANLEITLAIAYLHDVDDYKLVGIDNAQNYTNTNMILSKTNFTDQEKELIINGVKTIGYSKRLEGLTPSSIEAKIISDADMLEAMGVIGILRTYQYSIQNNRPLFDENVYPNLNMDAKNYKSKQSATAINHIFEKLLRLKDLMLTESGKKEALKRHNFMIDFLKEYFYEIDNKEWMDYLKEYVRKR